MSSIARDAAPAPGAEEGERPEIDWLPQWLEGGAMATAGPLLAFVAAIAAATPFFLRLTAPPAPGRFFLSLLGLAVPLALLLFWFPHWWAWRICGPCGKGRFLGAALWAARFPPKAEGDAVRVLTASALCAGDYLGIGAADGLGILTLALKAAREGDGPRSEALREIFVSQPRPGDLLARLVRSYALEAVAASHLRAGQAVQALAWAELGRGRGARYLRLLARKRLGEEVSPLRLAFARLLSPYRRDPLGPSVPFAEERLDLRGISPARLHLRLLAAAGARALTPTPLESLAWRWAGRLTPEASQVVLRRAAELEDPSPWGALVALEEGLRAELALLAAEARGEWSPDLDGELAATLREGRAAPLYAALEREVGRFREREGAERRLEPSLVEMERWLGMRLAAERLAELEGAAALSGLWMGGLRQAACNWPIRLWNAEGERALLACCLMSGWCAEVAERLGDSAIVEANREMVARCRRWRESQAAKAAS